MEMYMEDRKRLNAPAICPKTDRNLNVNSPIALKPKPILMEKQTSEPSSPEAKVFRKLNSDIIARKPIQRGLSDLGSRIKKRVTLR